MKKIISVAIAALFISGCTILQIKKYPDQEEMYAKSASMRKLSAAVESAVQYKNPPPELENEQLLEFATAHNPNLLSGFAKYKVKAKNINNHSLVLMCDREEKHALIEDSGCTGELDAHHWQQKPLPPCEFTLQVDVICN
jgi:hypothetical protein